MSENTPYRRFFFFFFTRVCSQSCGEVGGGGGGGEWHLYIIILFILKGNKSTQFHKFLLFRWEGKPHSYTVSQTWYHHFDLFGRVLNTGIRNHILSLLRTDLYFTFETLLFFYMYHLFYFFIWLWFFFSGDNEWRPRRFSLIPKSNNYVTQPFQSEGQNRFFKKNMCWEDLEQKWKAFHDVSPDVSQA